MLTGMGHPLLSNSHSIIPNPKSLFNMKEVNITLNEKDLTKEPSQEDSPQDITPQNYPYPTSQKKFYPPTQIKL